MFERIHWLMINKQVTKTAFCKAIGASTGSYGDWQSGRSSPGVDKLIKIADFFNVSMDYLCGREDRFPTPSPDNVELSRIYDLLDKEGKTIVLAEAYRQKQRMEGFDCQCEENQSAE